MKCEDVMSVLQRADIGAELAKRSASEHLATCRDCRNAAHALAVLRADRDIPIRGPGPESLERAIARASADGGVAAPLTRANLGGFWLGVVAGGAMAAALALAVVLVPRGTEPPAARTPQVTLNVNEERDVSVALNSPEPLENAEISIELRGDIGLRGFAGRRELRWSTNLERGSNQLTLPLVALGAGGGQVLVQVQHGDKRRSFVVDVSTGGAEPVARLFVPRAQAHGGMETTERA